MDQYDIPDTERVQRLEDIETYISRAQGQLNSINPDADDGVLDDSFEEIRQTLEEYRMEAKDQLGEESEWTTELVREIVLDQADRSDTSIERLDNELHFYFEVADYDHNTVECRWATAVTHDSEWFFIRQDDEWEEVWRAH